MSAKWQLVAAEKNALSAHLFPDLNAVFALDGIRISHNQTSELLRIEHRKQCFFVKRYHRAGNRWRRYLGRSRVRGEWENLQLFAQLNIATPKLVAYGEEYCLGLFKRGAIITRALPVQKNIYSQSKRGILSHKDRRWWQQVLDQLASYVRSLHQLNFIHDDLKWQNIVVDHQVFPQVYLLDCPEGSFRKLGYRHGVISDLRNLDKGAKLYLSRTQRLWFYKKYRQIAVLNREDKRQIRKIVGKG